LDRCGRGSGTWGSSSLNLAIGDLLNGCTGGSGTSISTSRRGSTSVTNNRRGSTLVATQVELDIALPSSVGEAGVEANDVYNTVSKVHSSIVGVARLAVDLEGHAARSSLDASNGDILERRSRVVRAGDGSRKYGALVGEL